MKEINFLRGLVIIWLLTFCISIVVCVKFLFNAYEYYNIVFKHEISASYTINNHAFTDTLTDDSFKKVLGVNAHTLSPEELTHQRLQEQSQIIELAKKETSSKMTRNIFYLLIAILIFNASQRWYRTFKKTPGKTS